MEIHKVLLISQNTFQFSPCRLKGKTSLWLKTAELFLVSFTLSKTFILLKLFKQIIKKILSLLTFISALLCQHFMKPVYLSRLGEVEDQWVVLLNLVSHEVPLHQSPQMKAASCLIHLFFFRSTLLLHAALQRLLTALSKCRITELNRFIKYGFPVGVIVGEQKHLCYPFKSY